MLGWESKDGTVGVRVDEHGAWLVQPQIHDSKPILLGETARDIKEIRALLLAAQKELPE